MTSASGDNTKAKCRATSTIAGLDGARHTTQAKKPFQHHKPQAAPTGSATKRDTHRCTVDQQRTPAIDQAQTDLPACLAARFTSTHPTSTVLLIDQVAHGTNHRQSRKPLQSPFSLDGRSSLVRHATHQQSAC
ncbi:hypothetical protein ABBQ38_000047 [Trebouxia sp. C0009 RCD-2024]